MVTIDATVAVADGQLSAPMDDGVVVLSMGSDTYFGFDEVGTRIWELVGEPTPVRSVVATITDEFEVDEGRCTDDVVAFLTDLEGRGLIRVGDGTP